MTPHLLINPHELAAYMEAGNTVVIDTRDAQAYAEGHIPGAVNMREIFTYLATTDPEGLDELRDTFASLFAKAGVAKESQVVFYEDSMNTGFGQSCRGYFLLTALGHDGGAVLHGGLKAWTEAGLPLSTETPVPTPTVYKATSDLGGLIATKEEMLNAISDPSVTLLDVRDRDEWEGVSSSPYGIDFCPRKGRIPGAVWIEWYRLMDEKEEGLSLFRSPEEIREACREVGILPGSQVYVYCFKGARASNTFVALHEAGIVDVKIYLGSWNEWSRDFSLPINEEVIAAA
jgi:thiosulfate/3-mercaptopyruvate sulfurtransferase